MLSALLARRTHHLHRWHCGLPSNTPAVQAGLFYGCREDVAGYRWFDRKEQRFKVVSSPGTALELEESGLARVPGVSFEAGVGVRTVDPVAGDLDKPLRDPASYATWAAAVWRP